MIHGESRVSLWSTQRVESILIYCLYELVGFLCTRSAERRRALFSRRHNMSTLSPFARLPNLDVASQVVFVQIGANDGKRLTGMPCGDPIYEPRGTRR